MTKSYSLSYQKGNIRAGNYECIVTPGSQRRPATKYPGILIHGSGGSASSWTDVLNFGSNQVLANLAIYGGMPLIGCDNSLQAWANDAAMTDITNQINYMSTKFGTPANKAVLIGGSMGGLTAIRYAILNPGKVAAVIGLIPLTDLKRFYLSALTFGIAVSAEVATAWGLAAPVTIADLHTDGTNVVTSAGGGFAGSLVGDFIVGANIPYGATITAKASSNSVTISTSSTGTATTTGYTLAPLAAGMDIQALASSLTVPSKFYYSPNDTIVFPAQQTAFAAAANGGAGVPCINIGPYGHSDQSIRDAQNYNGAHAADIIAFLQANGA